MSLQFPTLITALLLFAPQLCVDESPRGVKTEAWFEQRIRPVLAGICFRCHGGERVSGGLRVDSRQGLLAGGDSGAAIDLSEPASSLLLKAVARGPDVSAMPPEAEAALSADQIRDIRDWIAGGAFWPEKADGFEVQGHWAFQPLAAVTVPDVAGEAWVRTPVDAFVLDRMQRSGAVPTQPADRRTLIRRVTFDLTGLPPTADEVTAFLADGSPNAFSKVVDRLLASPAYGEKWGRHWLDLVRYADTAGETADYPVPSAWRYRNYVIDALNADLPYDQFVREQVAGDLLSSESVADRFAARTIATGFLAISRRFGFDSENYHHLTIQDTIDTVGQTFLGLSLGCARCHDHKFDPISLRDYYGLYGIFDSSRYPFPGSEQKQRVRALAPLCPSAEAEAAWEAGLQRTQQLTSQLATARQPIPSAVLRLTTDIDGDFELQAPAAGGSYGVLVAPWRYAGSVSVTAAAQSPFHNVYPGGSRGAAIAGNSAPWRIWQALHSSTQRTADSFSLNVDLRIVESGTGSDFTAAPRLTLLSNTQNQQLTLHFHHGSILLSGKEAPVQLGRWKSGEWFNLQLTIQLSTGALSGRSGTPESAFDFQSSLSPWEAAPDRLQLACDAAEGVMSAGVEVDHIAIRRTAFAPVSREFPLPPETQSVDSLAAAVRELEQISGIDGDLELQPAGAAPVAPWNPGPNSVVRLRAESQSPFNNHYSGGEQGFHIPGRSEYDGFGLTIQTLPRDTDGRIYAGFDFRVEPESDRSRGSWRYYLGHGPGSSAAVELFFSGDWLFCRDGEQIRRVVELRGGQWHQLQLTLDPASRHFSGRLLAKNFQQDFVGQFAVGWDGRIDYSFIDSYGHIPGQRPTLDADNFVLADRPCGSLDSAAPAASSAAVRRERIQHLQRRIREQQSVTESLAGELQRLLDEGPLSLAFAMSEGTPEDARIHLRGEPTQLGETVPRGVIRLPCDTAERGAVEGSGRLELANWLVDPGNPLAARVMVNRIWQHHFGQGLVATPNDFGVRGLAPTHPELLDWLAGEFIRQGWSIKSMHRLILNSAVWHQSSLDERQDSEQVMNGRSLLVGFARRRLTAEEVRDSILAVSGQLDRSPGGGHPFPAPFHWGYSQHAPFSDVYEHSRRSVYLMTTRLKRHPFLSLFDGADPNASTASRPGTTVPTQALFFLNDPLVHTAAKAWAESLLRSESSDSARLRRAWQGALQRDPDPEELVDALGFLESYRVELSANTSVEDAGVQPLAALLRMLPGSNEFLYVD